VLIVGRSGAGKSSLAEHATEETGYSGNGIDPGRENTLFLLNIITDAVGLVTTTCEILRKSINGTEYFFIDTPGFDDDLSAMRTFSKIAVLFHTIQHSAVLVGLWYVVDNTKRYTAIDNLTLDWLREFCGEPFLPNVTIVMTHWSTCMSLQELEHRSEQRMEKLGDLLRSGAVVYKHGRVYRNDLETIEIIPWNESGRAELIRQARDIIVRRSRGFTATRPRIIEELRNRIEIQNTAAGRVLLRNSIYDFGSNSTNENTSQPSQETDGSSQANNDENSAPQMEENQSFWDNWSFNIGLNGISVEYRGGGMPRGSLSVTTNDILSGVAATRRKFGNTATTSTASSTESATNPSLSSKSSSRWSILTDTIGEAIAAPPPWMRDRDLDDPFVQRMMLLDSMAMASGVYLT
jgi:GTP-binding protein EngB required for normal cell division